MDARKSGQRLAKPALTAMGEIVSGKYLNRKDSVISLERLTGDDDVG